MTEVLAPAGSPDMGRAVIAAGADAVYFAGEFFGARAYANNFTREESAGFLDLVHLRGKKAYLAVNTILKNREMNSQVYEELRFYYELGVDAVLVQDYGVLCRIRQWFPDWTIHASTQMNITTSYGADFLQRQGVRRIVLARELSLKEIRQIIHNSHVEVEVFVHGALCVCYSGNCLLSSFLGGRSGNRGRCAQPCRLSYRLLDDQGRHLTAPGRYLLSPKDLCTLEHIPALLDAGVTSLKIEGRMKQPQYAAKVTAMYRKHTDLYLAGVRPDQEELQKDMQILFDSGNRGGFTNAYLFVKNSSNMMSFTSSSHESKGDGKDKEIGDQRLTVRGRFIAKRGEPVVLKVSYDGKEKHECTVSGSVCERANNHPTASDVVRQKLCRTKEGLFVIRDLDIEMEEGLFIPHRELKQLRREALDMLYRQAVKSFRRCADLRKHVLQPEGERSRSIAESGEPELYLRVSNEIQLRVAARKMRKKKIVLPCFLADTADKEQIKQEHLIYELPVVMRKERMPYYEEFVKAHPKGNYEISSFDALGFAEYFQIDSSRLYAGYRLYMLSDQTRKAFLRTGIMHGSVPLEMSEKELRHRNNGRDRILVYGRIPMMYMANCVAKNTGTCQKTYHNRRLMYQLMDRKGKCFPVFCDCYDCVNVLYNADTLYLLDKYEQVRKLGCQGVELSFTTEDGAEMEKVLEEWDAILHEQSNVSISFTQKRYTRGHFGHSVE